MNLNANKGFTLIEILLVVALISFLAGIVIVAVNPLKQFADTRNVKRWSNVNTILNSVYQYAFDNNGNVPPTITTTQTEICKTGGVCAGLIDLSVLTPDLIFMPADPSGSCDANGVCYEIFKTADGRVTVAAPDAENGIVISVTR